MSTEQIHIELMGNTTNENTLWDEYVNNHPDSTIYHLSAFRDIFEHGFRYPSFYLTAKRGEAICGCLPLFLVNTLGQKRLVSVPFRDRGGVIADDNHSHEKLLSSAVTLAQQNHASSLILKYLSPPDTKLYERFDFSIRQDWIHSKLKLGYESISNYFQALDKKQRNTIRQALNAQLELVVIEPAQALQPWYLLHLKSQRKLGIPPMPLNFFKSLIELLRDKVRFYLVKKDEKYLCGSIILVENDLLIYGYSASDPKSLGLRPNDFMLYKIIEEAILTGYKYFDMGSDAKEQDSLLFFKQKWLASQSAVYTCVFGNADLAFSNSSARQFTLARSLFRFLPLPILKETARITKYFG